MAAGSVEQLRLAARGAWAMRWKFDWDINEHVISNVWRFLKWIFFAPGDLLLLLLMKDATAVAPFFGVTPDALSNGLGWSALLSVFIWVIVFIIFQNFQKYGTSAWR